MPDPMPDYWIKGQKYQTLLYFQDKLNKRPPNSEKRFKQHLRDALKGLNAKYTTETNKIVFSSSDKACPTKGKGYLIDFYLPDLKLGFEVDGDTHNSEQAQMYDKVRDSFLATRGILVIRFKNKQTFDGSYCVREITHHIITRENTLRNRKYANRNKYYKAKPIENMDKLIGDYLKNGGKITICPPATGNKTRREKGKITELKAY